MRCLHLVLTMHQNQIINTDSVLPTLDALRQNVLPQIQQVKDRIGFNLAGLRYLQQDIDALGVHTFDDIAPRAETGGIEKRRKVVR